MIKVGPKSLRLYVTRLDFCVLAVVCARECVRLWFTFYKQER